MKTAIKVLFSLFLAGLFLWFTFQNVDWTSLYETFQSIDPWGVIVAGIIVILSCLPRAWRWCVLLAPVSEDVKLWSAFKAVLIAYAGNNVFPRAGEFARVVALRREHPMPIGAVVATVIVERLLDMLTLLLLFAIVLFFAKDKIAQAFPGLESIGMLALIGLIFVFVVLVILSIYGDKAIVKLEMLTSKFSPNIADKISNLLRAFLQGMASVKSVESYVVIVITTFLTNLCYLLSVYFPFYSFNFVAKYGLNLFDALIVMVLASVGIVIPTPGGTGTYHFFCSKTLHIFFQIPEVEALAFATIVHGIAFVSFFLCGGPGLLRLLWTQKKEAQDS